jgi:sugar phosphate isomerase/epimerase
MDEVRLGKIESIGIFCWFGYELPMADRARMISEADFKSVMIWWSGDDKIDTNPPNEERPDLFRRHGLEIVNAHLPFDRANDLWEDTADGQSWYELLAANITECGQHGIPVVIAHPSIGGNPPPPNRIGLDRVKRLLEVAGKSGVDIAFENLRHPDYLDFVIDNTDSNRLKFCYDSGHEYLYCPDTDLLGKFGDRLGALHLQDNDGTADQHIMPFDGNIPWDETMARLRKTGYNGALTLECNATEKEAARYSPEEYLAECMKRALRLRELFNREKKGN